MTRARCKLTYSGSPLKALSTHTEFAIKGLNHNVKQARVWQGAFHHNLQKLPLEIECRNDDNMKPASAPPPSKAHEILSKFSSKRLSWDKADEWRAELTSISAS